MSSRRAPVFGVYHSETGTSPASFFDSMRQYLVDVAATFQMEGMSEEEDIFNEAIEEFDETTRKVEEKLLVTKD